MSLLADTYPDDKERSKAMGLALSGIALGVLSKCEALLLFADAEGPAGGVSDP